MEIYKPSEVTPYMRLYCEKCKRVTVHDACGNRGQLFGKVRPDMKGFYYDCTEPKCGDTRMIIVDNGLSKIV